MLVETYEIEEINSSEMAALAADGEALTIVDKLRLDGQKKLAANPTQTRMQFRQMTKVEQNVFQTLFPTKTKLETFDAEVIPVRALQAIEKAADSKFFARIEIWHSENASDPIAVGLIGEPNPQTWDADYINTRRMHLLCRWGDALDTFEKLSSKARSIWIGKRTKEAKDAIAAAQTKITNIQDDATAMFELGETVY